MTVTKRPEDFSWLDHKKYKAATDGYTLTDWSSAFYTRGCWRRDWLSEKVKDREEQISYLESLAHLEDLKKPVGWHPSGNEAQPEPIQSLSIDLIMSSANEIMDSAPVRALGFEGDEAYKRLVDNSAYRDENIQTILDTPYHLLKENADPSFSMGGAAYVMVDLWSTNEAILEAMKKWLHTEKAEYGLPTGERSFSEYDMYRWTQNRFLQYLDVCLLAELKNLNLTQPDLGDILFNDERVNRVDKVKRSVKNEAQSLTTFESCSAMATQVAPKALTKRKAGNSAQNL